MGADCLCNEENRQENVSPASAAKVTLLPHLDFAFRSNFRSNSAEYSPTNFSACKSAQSFGPERPSDWTSGSTLRIGSVTTAGSVSWTSLGANLPLLLHRSATRSRCSDRTSLLAGGGSPTSGETHLCPPPGLQAWHLSTYPLAWDSSVAFSFTWEASSGHPSKQYPRRWKGTHMAQPRILGRLL